jgi:serine phosphatase RsbU (regulator of sigma subunit)
MNLLSSFSLFISFALLSVPMLAQNGAPLLINYKESREIENQSWAICQDENNVMMFASRRGILTFDGQDWGFIDNIPTIPYSLGYNNAQRRVYVGGENNYGYLIRDEKGDYRFSSLLDDDAKVGLISKIIFTDSTVYFYGEESISRHNLTTGKLEMRLFRKGEKPFSGMFKTSRNIFINVFSEGLYRLESDTLFPIVTGYLLKDEDILFSLPYNDKMVLLGLGNGSLSLFDGIKFYVYPLKDDGYLKENILSDGIVISDTLYAFSTLEGGAITVARSSGAVRRTINYQRGLPDDEIFALGTDKNHGLWLSHQYGLTRAELILPVVNYTMYKGLMGNLISSVWHDNELYVATSEGVFFLSQIRSYAQEQVLVKKAAIAETPVETAPAEIPAEELKKPAGQTDVQKTKKSVFARIFGKKPTTRPTVAPDAETEKPMSAGGAGQPVAANKPETQYVRKTISRLKSVNYVFQKAEGLNEKCKQLISTEAGILVSTNRGLYVITNHKASPLVTERYIYFISSKSPSGKYYVATSEGYFYLEPVEGRWNIVFPDKRFNQAVYSVSEADDNTLWAGTDNGVLSISTLGEPEYRRYEIKSDFPLRYITNFDNDTLFIFSAAGISYYDKSADSLRQYLGVFRNAGTNLEFVISQPESPWIKNGDNWINLGNKVNVSSNDRALLKLFENIVSIVADDRNLWVISGDNQIYRITLNTKNEVKSDLTLFIRRISNDKNEKLPFSDIIIGPGENLVYFDIVAPGYFKQNSIQYQWMVDRLMENWSPWQTSSIIPVPLQHGTFTILVRAKDIWGNISEVKSITYTRKAPFTETSLFYISVTVILLVIIILIARFRERQLQKEKRILEEKVRIRTAEIEAQKEEITSSIEYASRIQHAMLPMDEIFNNSFSDHFIFFRPRDIVSGDFYWVGEDENHIFFTVADCTGHGVPGAFMSTLGVSTLNEIITNKKDLHANTVLNLLREKIKTSLHQTGKEGEATDGMDVSFCILHKNRMTLEYSGAFNPMIIIQNGEIKMYKADRMPIGIYVGAKDSFTNYELNISPGDAVYLFSDGMTDQFGGPDGAKYKKSNLKKLLSEIYTKPMSEQKILIEEAFDKWKGSTDQIDDITVIGIRI